MANQPLHTVLASAISDRDAATIVSASNRMKRHEPFHYSFLGDTVRFAIKAARQDTLRPGQAAKLCAVIEQRMASLPRWSQLDNDTVTAIEKRQIDAEAIKPHVRGEPHIYEAFYAETSAYAASMIGEPEKVDTPFRHMSFPALNLNHVFRLKAAVTTVETMITLVEGYPAPETVRWLDIGSGNGSVLNAVDPIRAGVSSWDFVGADFQVGRVAYAEARKVEGRTFIVGDAFDVLSDARAQGRPFHIASMFEFLEHLDDPLRFLRRLAELSPTFVIAGSPLAQTLDKPAFATVDKVHLWSFTRRAWEQMFTLAGLHPVYSQEARVGSYVGGLDWLTMIAGPAEEMKTHRTDWGRTGRAASTAEED